MKDELKARHDLLIVHGKNWRRTRSFFGPPLLIKLSEASKINALAAAYAYKNELAAKILFSTGSTVGKYAPSEARAMFGYLKRKGHYIPDSVIIFQEKSFNSETEVKENKRIIEALRAKNIAYISVANHVRRVGNIYKSSGLDATGYKAERLAEKLSPKKVQQYEKSLERKLIVLQEVILLAVQKIDKNGKLPTWLARRLRK